MLLAPSPQVGSGSPREEAMKTYVDRRTLLKSALALGGAAAGLGAVVALFLGVLLRT